MRTGLPIILFVAVAGFHNAISASLEIDESNKSPEERVYEENSTRTQPDESEYAAAHVTVAEDILRTTLTDGETEALTYYTEKRNDEESEETKALEQKDSDDAEKAALADSPDKDSEEDTHSEEGEENMRSIEENSDEFYEEEYQLAS